MRCASPQEQQQLMVAALSCNAAELYNGFVTAYQKDLQASDRALQNFFRRMNGKTGTADYHAFKTKMANSSSIQSIGDITTYCANAKAAFDTALGAAKTSLSAFMSGQTTSAEQQFTVCDTLTAGLAPKDVPIPRAKPVETEAVPAQGEGLSTPLRVKLHEFF